MARGRGGLEIGVIWHRGKFGEEGVRGGVVGGGIAETVRVEDELKDVEEKVEACVPNIVVFNRKSAICVVENNRVADRRVGQNVREGETVVARRSAHDKGAARFAVQEFNALLARHVQATPGARGEFALGEIHH